MGASKSKILSEIKSNTKHKIKELSLNDLLNENCVNNEFYSPIYREIMKDDLLGDTEEEEQKILRVSEIFKRDILLNFTDVNKGKSIPNLSNNYIFDRFPTDYSNSFYHDFNTKISKNLSFIISIFLNLYPEGSKKEEVVDYLNKFQENLSNDEKVQQKFFTIFQILNTLKKTISIDLQYEEFIRTVDIYTSTLENYIKDSNFVIFMIREQVMDIVKEIKNHILLKPEIKQELKTQAITSIFKLANCFKIADIFYELINLLKENVSQKVNVKSELRNFISSVSDLSFQFSKNPFVYEPSDFVNSIELYYDKTVEFSSEMSHCTDGNYIYIHKPKIGLLKIGVGTNNNIAGRVYAENKKFMLESKGSLVYCYGSLFFRNELTTPNAFIKINTSDLSEAKIEFAQDEETTKNLFLDQEKKKINLNYKLVEHNLALEDRLGESSKLISDGKYIYIYSKVSDLILPENVKENNLYGGASLYQIDIFDPINNFKYITSIPITDPHHLLVPYPKALDETITSDIITDGEIFQFYCASRVISFNLIKREISDVSKGSNDLSPYKVSYDSFNDSLCLLGEIKKDEIASTVVKYLKSTKTKQFSYNLDLKYEGISKLEPFSLITNAENVISESVKVNKEKKIYDFFLNINTKSSLNNENEKSIDNIEIISLILNGLSSHSERNLNFEEVQEGIIKHLYNPYSLNLNANSLQSLSSLFEYYYQEYKKNSKIETKHFIISSLIKLIKANVRQINLLKFNKFESFSEDFSFLKSVSQTLYQILSDFVSNKDQHSEKITVDLISQIYQTINEFSTIIENSFPDIKFYDEIMLNNSRHLEDLKKFVINYIAIQNRKGINVGYIDSLNEIIELALKGNNKEIQRVINDLVSLNSNETIKSYIPIIEYNEGIDSLFTPVLKDLFKCFTEFNQAKDEDKPGKEKIFMEKYLLISKKLWELIYTENNSLSQFIFEILKSVKFTNQEHFDLITDKIREILKTKSHTYRYYYGLICLINMISTHKTVIYKEWHKFYSSILFLDKNIAEIKQIRCGLDENKDKKAKHVEKSFLFETPHPVEKSISKTKKITFPEPENVYLEFDPFCFITSNNNAFSISIVSDGEKTEIKYLNNKYPNSYYENVSEITIFLNTGDTQDYGIKLRIFNSNKKNSLFNEIFNIETSLVLNALKSFFFLNFEKKSVFNKEILDLLQSKLFAGGINELLDFETSSEEYKAFIQELKLSNSFTEFERKLSKESPDEEVEAEAEQFDFLEIVDKEHQLINKLIDYFQKSLRLKFPWIYIGGENAERIVRANFAVVIKNERLFDGLIELCNSVSDKEEALGEDFTIQKLNEIDGYDFFLMIWSEVSRMRQWYSEQIKDLSESNPNDFDKQNQVFVEEVIKKCKFLFSINPKKVKKIQTTKIKFSSFFNKATEISKSKIENESVKVNIINWKKNLMNSKIEEKKSDLTGVKNIINTISYCIKLTKVSITDLENSLREINTRAKFREMGLSLMNSFISEIIDEDTKHYVIKQIVYLLRKIYSKKIISIEEEIKSASPSILNSIINKFHIFISLVYGNLIQSKNIFHIADYLDCLIWNIRARNHKLLFEISIFKGLFINPINPLIKEAWKNLTNNKMNFYRKVTYLHKYNERHLSLYLFEFYHILSSMIVGRIVEETEVDTEEVNFFKKKSSILDSGMAVEGLVHDIISIVTDKITEFIVSYEKLGENLENYDKSNPEEYFSKNYNDEFYLNSFFVILLRYILNQSNTILKHMKNPELASNLLILVQYSSPKNIFTISNILKILFKNFKDEDVQNAVILLKQKKLFQTNQYIDINSETNFRKLIINFLLNLVYNLRKGIYDKSMNTPIEYESSYHIIELLKNMYSLDVWRSHFDEIILAQLNNFEESKVKLLLPCLSVLHGDIEDFHYGSHVSISFLKDNPKSFSQRFKDKDNGSSSLSNGSIIGFVKNELILANFTDPKEFKKTIESEIRFYRENEYDYAVIAIIDEYSYSKNKLKSNEIEIVTKHVKDIISNDLESVNLTNNEIINKLIHIATHYLKDETKEITKNIKNIFDFYFVNLVLKVLLRVFDNNDSVQVKQLIESIGFDQIINLVSNFDDVTYKCLKANQTILNNYIKYYLETSSSLKYNFHDLIEDKNKLIYVDASNTDKQLKLYSSQESTNSLKINIINSNLTLTSETLNKIKKFTLVKFKDPKVKSYLHTAVVVDFNVNTVEEVNKIDDINVVIIIAKDFLEITKGQINHPHFIVENDYHTLENIILKSDINNLCKKLVKQNETSFNNIKSGVYSENKDLSYISPNDVNINECVYFSKNLIYSKPSSLKQGDIFTVLKKIIVSYLRYFLIYNIKSDKNLINEENFNIINKIFKITFFDCSQESNIFFFNIKGIELLNDIFNQLIDFSNEKGEDKFTIFNIRNDSKLYNSYILTHNENQIFTQIQSELVDLFIQKKVHSGSNHVFNLKLILNMILTTFNSDTLSFSNYIKTFNEILDNQIQNYIKSNVAKEILDKELGEIEEVGINNIYKYNSLSIENEKDYSSRTKIVVDFCYSYAKKIEELYSKLGYELDENRYNDKVQNSSLLSLYRNVSLIQNKAKDKNLRINSVYKDPEIKKRINVEAEIPVCNYTFEKKLNFEKVSDYQLTPNSETKGKILLCAEKVNNKVKAIEFVSDDDKNGVINIKKNTKLTIMNKELQTSKLFNCGYNERFRLGNESLSDYQYVFIPIEAPLDKKIRIKKVAGTYTSTMIITYDNKILVAGESYCSGLDSLSKTFTAENKWNNILKNEKLIEFCVGEYTSAIMVTNKGIYAAGYNSCGNLNDASSSGSYTDSVVKMNSLPFKPSKVVQVSVGYSHTVYRLDDGTVWGSGCNSCFEMNFDISQNYSLITKLNIPSNLYCERVSAGYHVTLFIMRESDGKRRLYSCGSYDYGHSGQGTSSDRRFKKVPGVEDIEFRWCKNRYLCSFAITTDNQLYTFGYGYYGCLANGRSDTIYAATKVDFFEGKQVLEADINEKNLAVKCIDNGEIKFYISGYGGYGAIGMGDTYNNTNYTPIELKNVPNVSRVSLGGTGYCSYVITTDLPDLDKLYEFKCEGCKEASSESCYITVKDKVNTYLCEKCVSTHSENLFIAINKINLFHNIKVIQFPDFSSVTFPQEDSPHIMNCLECNVSVQNGILFVNVEENGNQTYLCKACYQGDNKFIESPVFVYALKKSTDYFSLPYLNSKALIGYNSSLKTKLRTNLNSQGIKDLKNDFKEKIEKSFQIFDEIKTEHLSEYLRICDSEAVIKDSKLFDEEVKKSKSLSLLSKDQIDFIRELSSSIDSGMQKLRNFVDINNNNSLKEIYLSTLPLLSKQTRNSLFEKLLYSGACDIDPYSYVLRLSRGKALKFKNKSTNVDTTFTYTLFSQVLKEIKRLNMPISQYKGKKNIRLFKVELLGEGATDAGGPFREIVNIMCDDLQSSFLDLFIPSPNNKSSSGTDREKWTINPNARSSNHLEVFKQLGRIFGWAIRSTNFLNLNLPSFIWKQILNQQLDISDLERIDIHTANFLSDLVNIETKGIDAELFESIYDQNFITLLSNGKEVELLPGGQDKKLTFENRIQYCELALKARFDECSMQVQSIKNGLLETLDADILTLINWRDLEEKVCGTQIVDVDFLEKNTDIDSYDKNDNIIKWFWQALRKFSNDERILYLKFVWGRSRLPLTVDGFDRRHRITRMYSNHPDISLPVTHTCFFTIDIPQYSSFDILYNKLLYGIRFCGEIDNDFNAGQALEEI